MTTPPDGQPDSAAPDLAAPDLAAPDPATSDPARARFLVLNLLRLGGIVIMMLAVAAWKGDLIRPGGSPQAGAALLILGLIEALVVPRYLRRKWRSPRA